MILTKKIIRDGKLVGVRYNQDNDANDEFAFDSPIRNLYTKFILSQLKESGYKVYDYNGNIELPDGRSIEDLPAMDFSSVDFDMWSALASNMDETLTDAEASEFYSFNSRAESVKFAEPVSIEINTREELERFIDREYSKYCTLGYCIDNRPLNSFVNPEALYTMDEIQENKELVNKLNAINVRHTFKDYTAYRQVVEFLISSGKLMNDNPTMGEFVRAYYAWGPDGITGTCVDLRFKQGVDGRFENVDDSMISSANPETYCLSNRENVIGILGSDSRIRFLRETTSLQNKAMWTDFGRETLAILDTETLTKAIRRKVGTHKYTSILAQRAKVSDRLYFTFVTGNGYRYVYKVAHCATVINLLTGHNAIWYSPINFQVKMINSRSKLPMDRVKNEADYIMWNMCTNKVAAIMTDRTKTATIENSYQMLISAGLSPLAAVTYMARRVLKEDFDSNVAIRGSYLGLNVDNCIKWYSDKEVPEIVMKAFMLDETEITNVEDFIKAADADYLQERRDLMSSDEIRMGSPEFDPTFGSPSLDALSYYYNVKFVSDCMHGYVNIDNFGDGLRADRLDEYTDTASIFMSIIYSELGNSPDVSEAYNLIEGIETSEYYNINSNRQFNYRDGAYVGALLDRAYLLARKGSATDTAWWCYVTKVFRELSNKPIEEQRPYMLEMLVVKSQKAQGHGSIDGDIRGIAVACVENALDACSNISRDKIAISDKIAAASGKTYFDLVTDIKDFIAAELLFRMIGYKGDGENGMATFKLEYDSSGNKLPIPVPMTVIDLCKKVLNETETHVYYMPIYEVNANEYNPYQGSGGFPMHIVNAVVTPWTVTPRKGYKIKTMSLLPSYYSADALDGKNGAGWTASNVNKGNIIASNIKGINRNRVLPEVEAEIYMDTVKSLQVATYDDINQYLHPAVDELVQCYVKRWSLHCHEAMKEGKIVKSMPLKQDIVYAGFAPVVLGHSVESDAEYGVGMNTALTEAEVSVLTAPANALTMVAHSNDTYEIKYIYPGDITNYEFVQVYANLVGERRFVMVQASNVCTKNRTQIFVPKMSAVDANTLLTEYGVGNSKSFILLGIDGLYRVEEK
ncbi:MAG: hypothetical protein NC131_13065 [Roseburia sp.]|nr:hypothetical protein [Roseburia sp.]